MNTTRNFIKFLFLLIPIFPVLKLQSQDLLNSRRSSYYTYIYKLTDSEAKKIYKNETWEVEESYFHTLIDSFPTDSQYTRKLETGHYRELLKTNKFSDITVF